jgi:tyrosinase
MAGQTKVTTNFEYNPRCAKRDLTVAASSVFTYTNLYNLTLGPASTNIETFQNEFQGRFNQGFLGMHGAGHYAIGGDAGDVFSSPNDPAFWLHHSMLDRVWWIWQSLHLDQANTVGGTITRNNTPPSGRTTADDLIETNYLNLDAVKIGDVLSTIGGKPLCYIYL